MKPDLHLHPTLRRRFGEAAETALLAGAAAAIWISVIVVLAGALFALG